MTITPVTAPATMPAEDVELLRRAEQLLGEVWVSGRHEVATALRAADGSIHTGVHVEGSCRRSSICAEGVALGTARGAGVRLGDVVSVVSVQIKPADTFRVIAPCGVCRELISDYSPAATVWLTSPADDTVVAWRALELLPEKSRRVW
ncbi:cytidine deaminase [Actinoplanes sp. NBRC 101535]|nr:cytidine deaminase [Actinoplanes sp. NBRC 101535]